MRDTFGALPIDTAQRWLDGAPAAAALAPELRLLELALRHAQRHDDDSLGDEIDAVVAEFDAGADDAGAAVALALGALVAHTLWRRRPARRHRRPGAARSPPTTSRPVLLFLAGTMTAAVASLRGDADDATAAVAGLSFERGAGGDDRVRSSASTSTCSAWPGVPTRRSSPPRRCSTRRARTCERSRATFAGWPVIRPAFAGGRFTADPGAGTNERYLLYHAAYGTAVAASFGDRDDDRGAAAGDREVRRPVRSTRDRAMVALATAIRLIAEHDEAMARRVDRRYADDHGEDDAWADLHLRRILAPPTCATSASAPAGSAVSSGRRRRGMRAVADALLAARAGELGP